MAALRRKLGPHKYQMLQLSMAIGELNRRRVALAREANAAAQTVGHPYGQPASPHC